MTDQAIKQLEERLKAVSARLETVEKQLVSGGGASSSQAVTPTGGHGGGSSSAFVGAYDNLISTYIDNYVALSAKIDSTVKQQADLVKQAVTAQREFLSVASQSKKPNAQGLQNLLKPTADKMAEISAIRDKNRAHKHFNWLSTLSEGIGALGWVAVEPTPGPAVDDARQSSEFYSNKILVEFKNKPEGDLQRNWVAAWNDFLKELRQYVKQYHTTGVTWNPSGGDASKASTSAPPPPSGGGAPPPPMDGPPPPEKEARGASSEARAALFSEINKVKERQKGGKTEGLRKVQDHEKTKNQKISGVVKAVEKKPATTAAAKKTTAVTRPPKFALEGNKWVVEFQNGNRNIVIDETETRHTIYVYKCENSVVQVKGKVNAITLDSCKKTGLVFENAIASCEVVNSVSVQIQVTGKVPNIAVDKTDGCQVFLSKECSATEIVTSKISEMNVLLPPLKEGDDLIEIPVPEQYLTTIKDGKGLVTTPVSHLG